MRFPRCPDGSVDYGAIVRQFEAELADASLGEDSLPESAAKRSNEVNEINAGSPAEQEARALLDGMLAAGASFQVLRESGEAVLLWFGSAATVTPEIRAEVSRLKLEIVGLFLGGYPQSLRKWGRP